MFHDLFMIEFSRKIDIRIHVYAYSSRHVLPYGEAATSGGPAVGNKFPVTFYIQNSHRQGITRRIEVFKVCQEYCNVL